MQNTNRLAYIHMNEQWHNSSHCSNDFFKSYLIFEFYQKPMLIFHSFGKWLFSKIKLNFYKFENQAFSKIS